MSASTDDIKLHLQEAENLKKQWFSYVYASIHTLSDKIENNVTQLHKDKEELLKLIIKYRDTLLSVIKESNLENKNDLESLKDDINSTIDTIKVRLNSFNNKNEELHSLIKTELNNIKIEFKDDLSDTLKEHILEDATIFDGISKRFITVEKDIKTIMNSHTIVKTKLGIYIVIISFLITTFVGTLSSGLLILFRNAIKTYLGVH